MQSDLSTVNDEVLQNRESLASSKEQIAYLMSRLERVESSNEYSNSRFKEFEKNIIEFVMKSAFQVFVRTGNVIIWDSSSTNNRHRMAIAQARSLMPLRKSCSNDPCDWYEIGLSFENKIYSGYIEYGTNLDIVSYSSNGGDAVNQETIEFFFSHSIAGLQKSRYRGKSFGIFDENTRIRFCSVNRLY